MAVPHVQETKQSSLLFAGLAAAILVTAVSAVLLVLMNDPETADDGAMLLPGITLDQSQSDQPHLFISSVKSGSEAERSGLRAGEKVVAINSRPVATLSSAAAIIGAQSDPAISVKIDDHATIRSISLHRQTELTHGP